MRTLAQRGREKAVVMSAIDALTQFLATVKNAALSG
jgi:hypothetical protein